MVKMAAVFFSNASNLIKLTIGVFALVATLSAFYATSKSIFAMPGLLAKHDSSTSAGFQSLDRLLCIVVADHRKMDWQLCFIKPDEVMPLDGTH